MAVVGIIPARMASTRLPGKPLLAETGKHLIQHVCEQVAAARTIDRVIIATDDERVVEAVRSFGGEARLTRPDHTTGTDRIAEVAASLEPRWDLVVNVQGDEPEMDPAAVDQLVGLVRRHPDCPMATLACPFEDPEQAHDPNCVKVVLDKDGRALYFSRSLIPYPRDRGGRADASEQWLLHLGVYAYEREFLLRFASWEPTRLEQIERLEQLRALERGARIAVGIVERAAVGVDTPEDYAAFVERVRKRG
jgi:3-deoxy-manno-octulosonate cytidylyltransferase (CMP-KDO synthetase)